MRSAPREQSLISSLAFSILPLIFKRMYLPQGVYRSQHYVTVECIFASAGEVVISRNVHSQLAPNVVKAWDMGQREETISFSVLILFKGQLREFFCDSCQFFNIFDNFSEGAVEMGSHNLVQTVRLLPL